MTATGSIRQAVAALHGAPRDRFPTRTAEQRLIVVITHAPEVSP